MQRQLVRSCYIIQVLSVGVHLLWWPYTHVSTHIELLQANLGLLISPTTHLATCTFYEINILAISHDTTFILSFHSYSLGR